MENNHSFTHYISYSECDTPTTLSPISSPNASFLKRKADQFSADSSSSPIMEGSSSPYIFEAFSSPETSQLSTGYFEDERSAKGNNKSAKARWTAEEDEALVDIIRQHGEENWKLISLPTRTQSECLHRWRKVLNPLLVKGPWKEEEDNLLDDLVRRHGPKDWSTIAAEIPGRIGKQCRERWFNHLSPDVRKVNWSPEEDKIIIEAHSQFGNKWTKISKLLVGRPANAIKNHWNSTLAKRVAANPELHAQLIANANSSAVSNTNSTPTKTAKGSTFNPLSVSNSSLNSSSSSIPPSPVSSPIMSPPTQSVSEIAAAPATPESPLKRAKTTPAATTTTTAAATTTANSVQLPQWNYSYAQSSIVDASSNNFWTRPHTIYTQPSNQTQTLSSPPLATSAPHTVPYVQLDYASQQHQHQHQQQQQHVSWESGSVVECNDVNCCLNASGMCTIKESPPTSPAPSNGYVPNCYECYLSKSPLPFATPSCCSSYAPQQHHQSHQQQSTLPHSTVSPILANIMTNSVSNTNINNATVHQSLPAPSNSQQLPNAIFDLQQFFANGNNETATDCNNNSASSYESDFFWETIIDLPLSDCASY